MTDKQMDLKKQNLLQTFQAAGLQDTLKKEMRMKIIEKLQSFSPALLSQSFETRLVVSLISQYLIFHRLLYSNSLLLPETGYEGKTLNRHELASLNSLDQSTVSYSILEHILNKSTPYHSDKVLQNRQVQTYQGDFSLTIEDKFNSLEDQYREKLRRNQSREVLSTVALRRQIELQFKEQYDRDIRRFKQFQIQSIKLKQREVQKKKYQQYTLRIEQTYKRKLHDLRKQTTKMYNEEQSTRKQKQYFTTKQKSMLNQQKELIRMKQFQMDEKSKLLDMTKHIEAENIRKYQQELNNKIKEYDSLNLRLIDKINYEVGLVKLSLEKEYQDKQIEFLGRKKVVDEQYSKIQAIKSSISIIERQNSRLVEENVELRRQLQGSIDQVNNLLSDNKQNIARIDALKSQREELKEDIRRLQGDKKQMSVKINKYQNQLISTRKELEDARNRTGDYKQQSQDEQIKTVPVPIVKQSAVDDLLKKMEEISRNRRKDIESLKQDLDQ